MTNDLLTEAVSFITMCYKELEKPSDEAAERIQLIKNEIQQTGSYIHTYEELEHGAKMAWRNSNRCIGRLFWDSLTVFDKRDLAAPEQIKEALFNHLEFATNEGRIRPTITIFR